MKSFHFFAIFDDKSNFVNASATYFLGIGWICRFNRWVFGLNNLSAKSFDSFTKFGNPIWREKRAVMKKKKTQICHCSFEWEWTIWNNLLTQHVSNKLKHVFKLETIHCNWILTVKYKKAVFATAKIYPKFHNCECKTLCESTARDDLIKLNRNLRLQTDKSAMKTPANVHSSKKKKRKKNGTHETTKTTTTKKEESLRDLFLWYVSIVCQREYRK